MPIYVRELGSAVPAAVPFVVARLTDRLLVAVPGVEEESTSSPVPA